MKSGKRISSLSATESLSQSDDLLSSSPSAQDLFKLQKEILEQSHSIEEYIKSHQKNSGNNYNESISVLESLLSLFKLEVSMNLSLRKAIVNERKIRTKYENEVQNIEAFFQEFGRVTSGSKDSPSKINCFEDIFNYVISSNDKYIKSKKKMKSTISDQQEQINGLQQTLNEKEEEIQNFVQNQNEYEDVINKLKTKLLSTKTQINSLKAEIEQSNEIIRKQRLAIKEQKHVSSNEQINSQKEIDEIKQQCEQEIYEYQQKSHIQRQKYHNQQIQLKELSSKLKKKDEMNQNKENIYQCKFTEMQEQIQRLQDDNQAQTATIQSDIKKIEYLKSQISELENQLSESQKTIEKYESQLMCSKNQIDNIKSSFQNCRKKYEMKIHSTKVEHQHQINSMKSNIECSLEKNMRIAKQELKQKDDEILAVKAELETAHLQIAELVKKLKKQEKRRETDFQSAEELRIENERLRNMMREKSDGQKEVQNLLGLGPNATSRDIIDALMVVLSNNDASRHSHRH